MTSDNLIALILAHVLCITGLAATHLIFDTK